MKFAISTYLVGDLVSASECDYESSRDLGLKCPFCSSAVYLRRGYYRRVKGSKGYEYKQVEPFFAHYKAGTWDDYECENRLPPAKRQETLERIQIESKNQRLKLYNERLWEMFAGDRNISKQVVGYVRKYFGDRYLDDLTKRVRKYLGKHLALSHDLVEDSVEVLSNPEKMEEFVRGADKQLFDEQKMEYEKQLAYFKHECDMRMHKTICCEILDFLSTNTGGYALKKFLACLAMRTAQMRARRAQDMGIPLSLGAKQGKKETLRFFQDSYVAMDSLVSIVCATHWIEVIRGYLGDVL